MKNLYRKYFFILVLCFANSIIWPFYFNGAKNNELHVYFLDIGQGDSILIKAPNGREMLIDGGPDSSILPVLGKALGFFDRSIDVVLATHPDQDHIGGLPLVFDRYEVSKFIDSVADGTSNSYDALEEKAKEEGSDYFLGKRGMVVELDRDRGVYVHILYPNEDDFKIDETNELSIVAKLVYGDTSFMLTGDAGKTTEAFLVATDKEYLESTVLKAGHHGSKTSSSWSFVKAVNPKYAIISAGADNRYGHPHKETIDTLNDLGVEILSTYEEGTIEFVSNGVDVWQK